MKHLDSRQIGGVGRTHTAELSFSADGTTTGCSHFADRATFWDAESGQLLFEVHRLAGYKSAFSQNGVIVATLGGGEQKVGLWSIQGEPMATLQFPGTHVGDIVYFDFDSSDENLCYAGDNDVFVWNAENQSLTESMHLDTYETALRIVELCEDLWLYSVMGMDTLNEKVFRITEVKTGRCLAEHPYDSTLVVSPSGGMIGSGHGESLHLFEVNGGGMDLRSTVPHDKFNCRNLAFIGTGDYLCELRHASTKDAPSTVNVWDTKTGELSSSLDSKWRRASRLRASSSNQVLALVDVEEVAFIDPKSGLPIAKTDGHPFFYTDHFFSRCGRWFATTTTVDSEAYQRSKDVFPVPSGSILLTDLSSIGDKSI